MSYIRAGRRQGLDDPNNEGKLLKKSRSFNFSSFLLFFFILLFSLPFFLFSLAYGFHLGQYWMKTDILFLDFNEDHKDPTRAGVVLEPANHRSALEPSSLPAYVFVFFQKFKNNVDAGKLFVLFFTWQI